MRRRRPGWRNHSPAPERGNPHDPAASRSPATPPAMSDGLPPDGTWQVELTRTTCSPPGDPADITPRAHTRGRSPKAERPRVDRRGWQQRLLRGRYVAPGWHVKFDYDPAGGDCGTGRSRCLELDDDGLHLSYLHGLAVCGFAASPTRNGALAVGGAVSTVSPGLVDIGGRSLFMECRGSGSPTVVFLAGTRMPRWPCGGSRTRCWMKDPFASATTTGPARAQRPYRRAAGRPRSRRRSGGAPRRRGHRAALRSRWPLARWRPDLALRRPPSRGRRRLHALERRLFRARLGGAGGRLVSGRDRRGAGTAEAGRARSRRRPRHLTACRMS